MANEGKAWEEDFRSGFPSDRIVRLYDTTNGFKGVANPCDYIIFTDSKTVLIECKSIKDHRLPFANITDTQWSTLSLYRRKNVLAGVAIQFREPKELYFVDIRTLNDLRDRQGKKSITLTDCIQRGLRIPHTYKRTRVDIDGTAFMKDCDRFYAYDDVLR